jgi:hypothetical protein
VTNFTSAISISIESGDAFSSHPLEKMICLAYSYPGAYSPGPMEILTVFTLYSISIIDVDYCNRAQPCQDFFDRRFFTEKVCGDLWIPLRLNPSAD